MRVAAVLALLAAVAVTGALVVRTFGAGRAPFAGGSFGEVEAAMRAGGLQVCRVVDRRRGQANQAVASRQYEVAFDCRSGGRARVVADAFTAQAARDAAVRTLEVQVRPTGNGVAYTRGRLALFVFGPSDDAVQDRLGTIFRRLGAR